MCVPLSCFLFHYSTEEARHVEPPRRHYHVSQFHNFFPLVLEEASAMKRKYCLNDNNNNKENLVLLFGEDCSRHSPSSGKSMPDTLRSDGKKMQLDCHSAACKVPQAGARQTAGTWESRWNSNRRPRRELSKQDGINKASQVAQWNRVIVASSFESLSRQVFDLHGFDGASGFF